MSRKIVTAIGASIPHKAFDSKNGLQAINILRRISPDGHPNPKPRLAPGCLSAEKSRARFFAPLRCAQNDSMGDECTDFTLSGATDPLKATNLCADVLENHAVFQAYHSEHA